MRQIPQVQPWLDGAEQALVAQAIDGGWLSEGPSTVTFGTGLNNLIGAPYGVFAPNGTLALYLAILAAGIGRGDEVIVPDITFVASANAVVLAGATPVFADVRPGDYQLDVAACERQIGPRTRAIMPVHLFGACPDMAALLALAERHGLLVIEDAAQAIGVHYRGRHAGSLGDLGCFSFFADKTITTGEGGYVVCRDPALHERLLLLRNQGRVARGSFVHPALGANFRITDMQAALGIAQLDKLPVIVARKRALLVCYRKALAGVAQVHVLEPSEGSEMVPFRAVLLCERVAELAAHLEAAGVQTRRCFYPLHRQPCFAHFGRAVRGALELDDGAFPNAMEAYARALLLPIYPSLAEDDVRYICDAIRAFYGEGRS